MTAPPAPPAFVVRAITGAETRPLRHSILVPHFTAEQLVYPGDEAKDSLHVGAFVAGELAGIATIHRRPPPGDDRDTGWQIRGVATVPAHRGLGLATAMVEACIAHARGCAGTLVWCEARIRAANVYFRLGFQQVGPPFELPHIGTHLLMKLPLGAG